MKKNEFLEWLYCQGRFNTDFASFTQAVGEQLVGLGVPISRIRLNFRALHPQVLAWSCIWDKDQGAKVVEIPIGNMETEEYVGSPIQTVIEFEQTLRQSLLELPENAHSVLFELRDQGLTDYYATPLRFSTQVVNAATFATNHPTGFSDECIELLSQVTSLIAPMIETLATKRLARNLLETYIGPRTGRKIMEGKIQRGDGEHIDAAIWFSDFRNFTHYTETLTLRQMLDTLNQYFEVVHNNVVKHGGEVLRFIGDAMLIIFPVDELTTLDQACEQALAGSIAAQREINELNKTRLEQGEPLIEFGIGLHEGCVMYGNVGAPDRLDFTVMGTAVNRAARLESLTKELDSSILVSIEFNKQIQEAGEYQGKHQVKGVSEGLDVFAISVD